jgi:hypothetical protein
VFYSFQYVDKTNIDWCLEKYLTAAIELIVQGEVGNPKFRAENPKFRVKNLKFWVKSLKFCIENLKFRMKPEVLS